MACRVDIANMAWRDSCFLAHMQLLHVPAQVAHVALASLRMLLHPLHHIGGALFGGLALSWPSKRWLHQVQVQFAPQPRCPLVSSSCSLRGPIWLLSSLAAPWGGGLAPVVPVHARLLRAFSVAALLLLRSNIFV